MYLIVFYKLLMRYALCENPFAPTQKIATKACPNAQILILMYPQLKVATVVICELPDFVYIFGSSIL